MKSLSSQIENNNRRHKNVARDLAARFLLCAKDYFKRDKIKAAISAMQAYHRNEQFSR